MVGDLADKQTLFNRYGALVYRLCWSYLGSEEAATTTATTVFFQLFDDPDAPDGSGRENPDAVRDWLVVRTRDCCLDALRAARHAGVALVESAPHPGAHSAPSQPTAAELVQSAIQALPNMYKPALYLHCCEGLEPQEIAGMTGVNAYTVQNHLEGARKLLAAQLAGMMQVLGAGELSGAVRDAYAQVGPDDETCARVLASIEEADEQTQTAKRLRAQAEAARQAAAERARKAQEEQQAQAVARQESDCRRRRVALVVAVVALACAVAAAAAVATGALGGGRAGGDSRTAPAASLAASEAAPAPALSERAAAPAPGEKTTPAPGETPTAPTSSAASAAANPYALADEYGTVMMGDSLLRIARWETRPVAAPSDAAGSPAGKAQASNGSISLTCEVRRSTVPEHSYVLRYPATDVWFFADKGNA